MWIRAWKQNGIIAVAIVFSIGVFAIRKGNSPVPLPNVLDIEVTGENFEWTTRYAGGDETLHTEDDYFTDGDISLIAGTQTKIRLVSRDYIYSFAIPDMDLKEIAVPDLEFALEFCPQRTGDFVLKGDQLCGYQHPNLIGKIRVLKPHEFVAWQNQREAAKGNGRKYEKDKL